MQMDVEFPDASAVHSDTVASKNAIRLCAGISYFRLKALVHMFHSPP